MSVVSSWPTWLVSFWDQWGTLIRIALIVAAMLTLRWALLISVRKVVSQVVSGARGKTRFRSQEEANSPIARERVVQRTETIGSVLKNLITWTVTIVLVTMVMAELGVEVGALAAGAGLIGAGIGFGAQQLVRDLISGLFIVFEDQYGVGDQVNLGDVSGVVEAVGLRATQVRDGDGVLWYVRNGEVLRVGNQSQGWSRAIVDVALLPNTDWQKTKTLLEKAVAKVVATTPLSEKVIGSPEVWGIHALSGDQVVLRIVQKVSPNAADEVAREIRGAVKTTLDAAKIAMATEKTLLVSAKQKN